MVIIVRMKPEYLVLHYLIALMAVHLFYHVPKVSIVKMDMHINAVIGNIVRVVLISLVLKAIIVPKELLITYLILALQDIIVLMVTHLLSVFQDTFVHLLLEA